MYNLQEATWSTTEPSGVPGCQSDDYAPTTESIIKIPREIQLSSFMYLRTFIDGAILSVDSRVTHEINGVLDYSEAQKAFLIPGTNIAVGFISGLGFSGMTPPFSDIIQRVRGKTRYEIAHELFNLVKIHMPLSQATVWVVESEKRENGCVICVSSLDVDTLSKHPIRWVGSSEPPCGTHSFAGVPWACAYAQHAVLPCATIEQGLPIVRQFMENIRDTDQQLAYSKHTIGGKIKCVVLTPEKAEFA